MSRGTSYSGERNANLDAYVALKNQNYTFGWIQNIDTFIGTMDVYVTDTVTITGVLINMGQTGIYHGMRAMPRLNDFVVLGFDGDGQSWHVCTLPYKYAEHFQTTGQDNPYAYSMRQLKEGETELMSCTTDGLLAARLSLLQSGRVELNANGCTFTLDPNDGMFHESQNITMRGDQERVKFGAVKRKDSQGNDVIRMTDGVPWTGVGNPLQECIIAVNQPTDPSTDKDSGDPNIKIHLSDEILDDNANPMYEGPNKIQGLITFKAGATITIDVNGGIVIHSDQSIKLDANAEIVVGNQNGYVVTSPYPGELVFSEGYTLTAQLKTRA